MESKSAGLAAVSSLEDPVRRRLYDFVAGRDQPAGRDEAAAAARIGRPLAAYHLDKLVDLGLLTAAYRRRPGRRGPGAGRPAKVYARSGTEFAVTVPPREYELAARLLAIAVEADDGGGCHEGLREAARQYGIALGARAAGTVSAGLAVSAGRGVAPATGSGGIDPADGPDGPDTTCRADGEADHEADPVLAVLRAHGFEPWREGDGVIRLRNCPFRELAASHRDLVCGMNLALIGGIVAGLGADGELSPALRPGPGHCCVVLAAGQHAGRGAVPCLAGQS
ncbi:MAG: transcriptional regulator [Streptosporangiaceae bacterium]